MKTENICQFIPFHKDYYSFHTINFVLETKCPAFSGLKVDSLNKIYLVTEGEGTFHITGEQFPISRGNMFFSFPAVPFAIEAKSDDFKYMYISFLGERANMLMDQLELNSKNFLFSGFDFLEDFWTKCINSNDSSSILKSESALLYSFAVLGEKLSVNKNKSVKNVSASNLVKKYIDDNYTDSFLTLKAISQELKYNQKYLSVAFKKDFGIGISRYLNTIRIQHACTLISQGFESISDISYQSGFSDPQYFSNVFKKFMGLSPKNHINFIKKSNDKDD